MLINLTPRNTLPNNHFRFIGMLQSSLSIHYLLEIIMRKALITTFVLTSLFSMCSLAEAISPIEEELTLCLSKNENQTTAGMNNCVNIANLAWDKELNTVYRKLMLCLTQEGKKNLKNSQIAWLKHRDLEFKLINSIYENKAGSMYTNIKAMNVLVITRNRTLELNSYL